MTFSIDYEVQDKVLIARCSGDFDSDSDEKIDRLVAEECRRLELRKVLIDFRTMDGFPSTIESFTSGTKLGERGFRQNTLLAFLDRPEYKSANAFYELVANNRGFKLRHFYTEEEALEWLTLTPATDNTPARPGHVD